MLTSSLRWKPKEKKFVQQVTKKIYMLRVFVLWFLASNFKMILLKILHSLLLNSEVTHIFSHHPTPSHTIQTAAANHSLGKTYTEKQQVVQIITAHCKWDSKMATVTKVPPWWYEYWWKHISKCSGSSRSYEWKIFPSLADHLAKS